ncbi:hypothetical protein [Actinomyces bowdenii]|uniref:hypothetical protein n=1 Tax=Actinomyces bowdenii TaxID=131109 RepID=UPI00163A1355|nr:hypothetical protein [Actinomyces bowdenii]
MQCARIIRTTSDQALAARLPDVVDLVGDPVERGGASGGAGRRAGRGVGRGGGLGRVIDT